MCLNSSLSLEVQRCKEVGIMIGAHASQPCMSIGITPDLTIAEGPIAELKIISKARLPSMLFSNC